jgi:hypothetical protein
MGDIPIQVDPNGFVWYDGVKLPVRFIAARRSLEFFDKDKRRSEERGSRIVEITIEQFASELLERSKIE